MISLSAAILVATCTATFGLHSSSSTTSSYSYFALASALRSCTARSAELRPPKPLAETPPVSGPMKPTLTLSFASTGAAVSHSAANADIAATPYLIMVTSCGARSTGVDLRRVESWVKPQGCLCTACALSLSFSMSTTGGIPRRRGGRMSLVSPYGTKRTSI